MECLYKSRTRDEVKKGKLKKGGNIFILFSEHKMPLDKMFQKKETLFYGSIYIASTGEELELTEKIKDKKNEEPDRGSVQRRKKKIPPPPEGSLIFTSRAYIEPALLRMFKEYQVEGVRFMFERLRQAEGAVLADEMGLGKTFQAIAIIRLFSRAGGKVLVVAPSSLVGLWEREVKKWAPEIRVYNGVDKSLKKYTGYSDVVGLSYEKLSTWKEIGNQNFSLIVCDEAHRLRSGSSLAIGVLRKLSGKRLLLTGTPFQNSLQEYKNLLSLVDPRADKAVGAKELSIIAGEAVLRRKIERTSLSLPQRDEVTWIVKNREFEETKKQYEDMSCSLGIQALQKLRGIASLSPSKWRIFSELVMDSLLEERSLVVISRYIETIKQTDALIKSLSRKKRITVREKDVLIFHGEMPVKDREESLRRFQEKGQRIIILSAKCGAEGLTLIKATRMIILDSDWNPANDQQAMARIWRLGQKLPVVIHRMFLMGSVEEHVLLVQLKKIEVQKSLEGEISEVEDLFDPQEISGVFIPEKHSVVHRWMGCRCTEEAPFAERNRSHVHTEDALIFTQRTNGSGICTGLFISSGDSS
ncbi:DNA repair and recombination protein RAD54B [Nematocida sp. LUAm3]|nr:DNA repair and recombination protein RAD54B [Nematocida sp. LUAm3]KAI5175373.1 DNA repair and recombination protein RAD54B [Nematocida sp. LUAm2]KAI5177670.1 DNA repair and recombination protein RAD54B [Nematocida sp. LUAm1]